jgi:pimeloyl-ACP methyl ester carboxylesterase
LQAWGAEPELVRAGLCHAAYGTTGFPTALFSLAERGVLRSHIGDAAEAIVYAYCASNRRAASRAPDLHDRFTSERWVVAVWLQQALAELTAANELDILSHASLAADAVDAIARYLTLHGPLLSQAAWAAVCAAVRTGDCQHATQSPDGDRVIAYQELGTHGARALLWHGGASPELTWSCQRALASELQLRIPWRRGYSPSAPAARQDWEVDARDLLRVMPGRTHGVAHSIGALSALVAAAAAPERFASLILIEPPLFSIAAEDPDVRRVVELSRAFSSSVAGARDEFLALAALPKEHAETARIERLARGMRDPLEAAPVLDALRDSRVPVAIVSGLHERGIEKVCDALAESLGAQRWRLAGKGHAVQRHPDFNSRLGAFIAAADTTSLR